jgi:hypothetical protein
MATRYGSIILALVAVVAVVAAQNEVHEITSLPGLSDPISFKQYSGYALVNPSGRRLFFWFAEAQSQPEFVVAQNVFVCCIFDSRLIVMVHV